MVTKAHTPKLSTPFYADAADPGMIVHRYFDEQFIPCFLQAAGNGQLTGNAHQAWRLEDRFGRHRDMPHLRLPVHRTFYVACTEVCCDTLGAPALSPERIVSAGFVIRRRGEGGIQRWMLRDGQALGWRSGAIPLHDPNEHRRLVNRLLVPKQLPEPP